MVERFLAAAAQRAWHINDGETLMGLIAGFVVVAIVRCR